MTTLKITELNNSNKYNGFFYLLDFEYRLLLLYIDGKQKIQKLS